MHIDLPGRLFAPVEENETHCRVADLSPDGTQVVCEYVPAPDTAIILYIDGFGRFEGSVARAADGCFGIKFACSALKRERVAEQLTLYMNRGSIDESVLRRHDRTPTKGLARFTRANGDIVGCEVLYLSLGGVSLKTDIRPLLGDTVLIGQMAGRVVCHHETGIALEFIGQPQAGAECAQAKLSAVR